MDVPDGVELTSELTSAMQIMANISNSAEEQLSSGGVLDNCNAVE